MGCRLEIFTSSRLSKSRSTNARRRQSSWRWRLRWRFGKQRVVGLSKKSTSLITKIDFDSTIEEWLIISWYYYLLDVLLTWWNILKTLNRCKFMVKYGNCHYRLFCFKGFLYFLRYNKKNNENGLRRSYLATSTDYKSLFSINFIPSWTTAFSQSQLASPFRK